ncbi:MAG: prenyltransferase/squalene oxidase repeat-containing protein [Planctomycetota bacterium]
MRKVVIVISISLLSLCAEEKFKESKRKLEETYKRGAQYLIKQQKENGAWQDLAGKDDVAITAIAVISLSGCKKYKGLYKKEIEKGVKFLIDNQQPDGGFYQPEKTPFFITYPTALSIVALKTVSAKKYNRFIRKAVVFLSKRQYSEDYKDLNEKNRDYGGWAYGGSREKENKDTVDLSNTTYAVEALRKAGLPKDSVVWKRVIKFLSRTQNFSETNDLAVAVDDGGFVYAPGKSKAGEVTGPNNTKGPKSYGSMTYAGLLSFIYAYVSKNDQRVQAAFSWIKKNYTLEENPGLATEEKPVLGKQGLFYYYHTFAKALYHYGEDCFEILNKQGKKITTCWALDLVDKLSTLQQQDGSWKNDVDRWWESYPVLTTSYSLIALNYARKSILNLKKNTKNNK